MSRHLLFIEGLASSLSISVAQSLTSCSAESVIPRVVSVEGFAELIPDYVIHCRGGLPTPAGQPIPRITLQALFNSTITSKVLGPAPPRPPGPPQLTEALLLIDEPAPNAQLPCPTLPCSIQGTGGSTSPYDGSAGHYNAFQATQTQGNMLEWAGIPFDPPGPGATRTLRITNLRANLEQFLHVMCLGCLGIQVVGFISSPDLAIDNPQQTLAYGNYGLAFQSTSAVLPPYTAHNAAGPLTDFLITFSEGESNPNSFKPRTITSHPDDTSSNANQNIPGKSYPTASGFYNAGFTGTYAGAGLATQGTRLVARFENVPSRVSLFVTQQPIAPSPTLRVQLITTGSKGEGPYQPVPPTANGYAPLAVNNGVAIAVWEVTSANPTTQESAQFGVGVSFSANPGTPFVQAGTTTVRGSLGPLSNVYFASAADPAPRYTEGPAQPAFRIGVHLTPSVTAIVNAAGFAPNSPVAPGSIAAIFGLFDVGPPFGPTTVRINGITAPVFGATSNQVNVQIPWELAGTSKASLVVTVNGVESDAVTIQLTDAAAGIFLFGNGQPMIARSLPWVPGASLTIIGTGCGPVQNQPATSSPAVDFTSTTLKPVALTIGGVPAEITYSGLAPGITGVCQVNAKVPDVEIGPDGVFVQLSIGGVDANPVTLKGQ